MLLHSYYQLNVPSWMHERSSACEVVAVRTLRYIIPASTLNATGRMSKQVPCSDILQALQMHQQVIIYIK